MTYYTGSVVAVPTANKDAYRDHAAQAWPFFRQHGALRLIETWGEDVPRGEVTDFYRAVQARDDETVVFSWIEWPDRETAEKGWQALSSDPEVEAAMGEMPYDGKRMIFGSFAPIFDRGN